MGLPYDLGLNPSEDDELCAEFEEWKKTLERSVDRASERFGREAVQTEDEVL